MPVSLARVAIAFVIGLGAVLSRPDLPGGVATLTLAGAAGACAVFGRRQPWALLLGAVLAGSAYGLYAAQDALGTRLPLRLQGRDAVLVGRIIDLPQGDALRLRLRVQIEQLTVGGHVVPGPRRALLSWYGERPILRAGERWQLTVRLKAPRGFRNPQGFDYERWLTGEGVDATGYVRAGSARRLPASVFGAPVQHLRQVIGDGLDRHLGHDDAQRMVRGLAIGVTGAVTSQTWRTLRETGTAHLLAISGLHVALAGVVAYAIVGWAWRQVPELPRRLPAPRAAALAAAVAVVLYAALAGFAIPARRTALMFSVAALGAASGRDTAPGHLLALAALVVLLTDPLAVLASGFWLSFGAVAILLWLGMGRLSRRPRRSQAHRPHRPTQRLREFGLRFRAGANTAVRLQLAIALALTPLTLGFFGLLSPTSVPANLVAVPLLGLVAVPLTLLGVVCLPLAFVADPLLQAATAVCAATLGILETLQGFAPGVLWPSLPVSYLVAAAVGVMVLLLPRGFPGRWLGILWCVPALAYRPPLPAPGTFTASVLDVGQGLAVVVRTQRHALVYDSGPRYSDRFSAGEAIVLPELARVGVRRLDLLLLSHGDADHAGAAADIVSGIAVERIASGTPQQLDLGRPVDACTNGHNWQWDGVRFEQFYPSAELALAGDNDRSCVLMISAGDGQRLLLTGDIEVLAQRRLVGLGGLRPVDVLVAPHHGSRSALFRPLIAALSPREVIFSAGYLNRFGHPHQEVVAAYTQAGARRWSTASAGALRLRPSVDGLQIEAERQRRRHWWQGGAPEAP